MKNLFLSLALMAIPSIACVDPVVPGWSNVPSGRSAFISESSGSDKNPGSQAQPFKTVGPALSLLNNGKIDSVLFHRGETFHNANITFGVSGTAAQPIVVSSYGTGDRPILLGGGFNFFQTPVSHIAIVGLHLQGTPGSGAAFGIRNVVGAGTDALIEDCLIEKYVNDIGWDAGNGKGQFTDLRIRRNEIIDATSPTLSVFTQGVYISHSDKVLIEENFFDHNGFNGPKMDTNSIFNHHVYYQDDNTSNVKFIGNVVTRGADGVQLRPGGIALGNFLYDNAIGFTMRQEQGGSLVDSNVVLHAGDISASTPRGFGVYLDTKEKQLPGNAITISNNIFAFNVSSHPSWGAAIQAASSPGKITISNNSIFSFGAGILAPSSATVTGTSSSALSRSLPGYLGMSESDFYLKIRSINKLNWNADMSAQSLINWIKGGFSK